MPLKLAILLAATAAIAAAQSPRRAATLVVIGGTVITQNAAHAILSPGAVAIDGTDIVDVDTPDGDRRAATARRRPSTRATRSCCPA